MKDYITHFLPCENAEDVDVWKENGKWWFKCQFFSMLPIDMSDLERSERREKVNLLKGISDERIKYVALARAIRDYCFRACKYAPKNKLTDPKHVKAHHLVVFLVMNYDFSLAEDTMRFGSKGNDTIRRMLGNIYKGYVQDIKAEYRDMIKEIVKGVDEEGRASIEERYYKNHTARKQIWDKIFEQTKSITDFVSVKVTEKKNEVYKGNFKHKFIYSEDGIIYVYHEGYRRFLPLKYIRIPVNDEFKEWIRNFLEKGKETDIEFKFTLEVTKKQESSH